MKKCSRILALSLAALVATVVLTGCGDDDDGPSSKERAAAAGVQACRAFFLAGGATGDGVVRDLNAILSEGSYQPEPLRAELLVLRTAAAESGSVPDLPDADYRLFRDVVAAVAQAEGDVAEVTNTRSLEQTSVEAVRDSLDAVEKRCG